MAFDDNCQRRDMSAEFQGRLERAEQHARQIAILVAHGQTERAHKVVDSLAVELFPPTLDAPIEDYVLPHIARRLVDDFGIVDISGLVSTPPVILAKRLGIGNVAEIYQMALKRVAEGKIRTGKVGEPLRDR
jgi:hypothetical protein